MKYWLLTTEYPPAHGGGISTYCRYTAEMLAGRQVQVTVIVADRNVTSTTLVSMVKNLMVVRFNPDKMDVPAELGGTATLSYAFYCVAVGLIKETGAPDLIESQDYLGIAYYIQQFKLLQYQPLRDIPIVISIHAPAFVYLPYNKVPTYRFPDYWTTEMEKQSIRAADLVISPSEFMAVEIGRYMDLSVCPVHIVPYPYRRLAPAAGKVSSFQRNKIVYYGKLSPQKGTFELLCYFRKLWDEGFPHSLHIIGGGDIVYHPEKMTMDQLVRKEYRQYIRNGLLALHGKIDPSTIGTALADAHVVVLPSIVDNLPYACIETMDCCKVVLASIQGGQREIITDKETGFLFDHENPLSFREKLLQILALPDEEVQRIGRNARASLSRYDYAEIGEKKLRLIDALHTGYHRPERFPFLHQELCDPPATTHEYAGLLSVVIPFFNLGKYLDECIRSLLSCTCRDLEIIVVNDGSTDMLSCAVLEKWRDHPEVIVVDQPNSGLAAARNTGARRATGRFLSFLDADDTVLADYYEKAVGVLIYYDNVHFVGCWVRYFGGATGVWPAFTPSPPYFLAHNTINSSALVYKTASFLAGGLNDPRLIFGLEDYESVIQLLRQGFNGVALPECLYRYRVRAGSMFRRTNKEKLLWSYHYILEKHRAYYQGFAMDVIHLLNANGPGYLFENPTLEVFISSSTQKPGSWRARLKAIARRSPRLKNFLLNIRKKTYRLWQIS